MRYDSSSTSHEERRHQLDLRLLEITDLRRALSTQSNELEKAHDENDRISADRRNVARLVEDLEGDLRRVKKDAEVFQHDLKILRSEKDRQEKRYEEELERLERSKKQTQTQLRLMNEELDVQRARISQAKDELQNHVCKGNGG
jgi:chromosome segregation ATPase